MRAIILQNYCIWQTRLVAKIAKCNIRQTWYARD